MAERELAVEAGQQVEAKDRDGVDDRERDLEDVEIFQDERDRKKDHEPGREREHPQLRHRNAADGRRGGAGCFGALQHHTLVTTGRPNRPLGFTVRIATMMISAIESFISRPTTGM